MIITLGTDPDGTRIMVLGLTRENVRRLTDAGQPITVGAVSHPGFPADLQILIVFQETERALANLLGTFTTDETKIVTVPRPTPGGETAQ